MVEFLISYSIGLSFQCVSFVSEYIVIGIQAFRSKDYGYEGILSERVAIIPEILKSNGYRTFMSGKWHIGGDPISRGFDDTFVLLPGAFSSTEVLSVVHNLSSLPIPRLCVSKSFTLASSVI